MANKPFPAIGPRVTPGLDWRYNNQVARYNQGVENGTLDEGEQAYLKKRNEQARVGLFCMKYDDGKIDLGERIQAHKFLNRTSAEIFAFKHDQA